MSRASFRIRFLRVDEEQSKRLESVLSQKFEVSTREMFDGEGLCVYFRLPVELSPEDFGTIETAADSVGAAPNLFVVGVLDEETGGFDFPEQIVRLIKEAAGSVTFSYSCIG
jgi:hypothetical protein